MATTSSTTNVRAWADTRRAFVEWIEERGREGERLLVDDLAASPRYYFEQNSSQYAAEFFTRMDRWRGWLSGLISGLNHRVRRPEHLVQDAAGRFAEERLLTFKIADFNNPSEWKAFDLRDRVAYSIGNGWSDLGQWFRRGREEPVWDHVRQVLVTEVRAFTAMVLEQLNDLELVVLEVAEAADQTQTAPTQPIDQSDRFTELEAQGEGAHASVWKARDTRLNRVVALRIVRSSAGGDQEAIAHARTMAKPPHPPTIVTVYELVSIVDPADRHPVVAAVLEFVDGDKLRTVCKRQLAAVDARKLCVGILAAVAHYHANGFAHLDLHADNVLASKSMDAKILDPRTYRTEMFATTQLIRDQVVRDVRDATFLLRDIITNSELSMEAAVRFHDMAADAMTIAELRVAFDAACATTAPSRPAAGAQRGQIDRAEPAAVFGAAIDLIRASDRLGWRQLENELRRDLVARLHPWRKENESRWAGDRNKDVGVATTDSLLDVAMPRLAFALAGVYSDNELFVDQRRLVDDLLAVPDWSAGGTVAIVEAPRALVFVFHYLHGALCMVQGQADRALDLADVAVADRQRDTASPLWTEHDLTGWPKLLGGTCTWAWEYLSRIRERRPVLEQMFVLKSDYEVGLASYSMLLSLNELATDAARAKPTDLSNPENIRLDVPPLFVGMSRDTIAAATKRTLANRAIVERVAQRAGAKPEVMRQLWPAWRKLLTRFSQEVFERYGFVDSVPLADLG